jgi:RNA polymerase sigma factor (sigma-70 family)
MFSYKYEENNPSSCTAILRGVMEDNRSKTLELVKKASAGDINAFEELYSLKLRTILYHINSLLKSPDEAEDVAQEVGLRIFQSLPALKAPEAFHVWMQRIITTECYRHMHKNDRVKTYANIDDYTDTVEEENKEFLPDEFAEAEDQKRIILRIIGKLPPQRKRIIIMYYYDDMSYKDIAYALGLTTSTVSTSIMKAKKMIKKEIERKTGALKSSAQALPALTVVGRVIDSDAALLFPQSRIDSIVHSVNTAVEGGVLHTAIPNVAAKAVVVSVATQRVLVVTIAVVIVIIGSTINILHQSSVGEDDPSTLPEVASVTEEAATPADLVIAFTGGECECGHLNPKNAGISGTTPIGPDTTWQITDAVAGEEISAGTGEDVAAPIKALLKDKEDGTYRLIYTNTSETGHVITLSREFVIDTGDKTYKKYQ